MKKHLCLFSKKKSKADMTPPIYVTKADVWDEGFWILPFRPNVSYAPFCEVGYDQKFGKHTTFGEYCTIGGRSVFEDNVTFGANCIISENCLFKGKVHFGPGCEIEKGAIFKKPEQVTFSRKCHIDQPRTPLPSEELSKNGVLLTSCGFSSRISKKKINSFKQLWLDNRETKRLMNILQNFIPASAAKKDDLVSLYCLDAVLAESEVKENKRFELCKGVNHLFAQEGLHLLPHRSNECRDERIFVEVFYGETFSTTTESIASEDGRRISATELFQIENGRFGEREQLLKRMANPLSIWFVAYCVDELGKVFPVAYQETTSQIWDIRFRNIVTKEEYQNEGIATILYKVSVGYFCNRNLVVNLVCHVKESNKILIQLHDAIFGPPVAIHKNYYADGADAACYFMHYYQ